MLVGTFEVPSSPASHAVTRLESRQWLASWRHAALMVWTVPVAATQTASAAAFPSASSLIFTSFLQTQFFPPVIFLRCRNQPTEQETFCFRFPIFVLLKLRFLGLPTEDSFLCHREII